MAINSGLVEFPTGYDLAWQGGNVCLWKPTAPPGYAPIGCVFGLGSEPPALSAVVCVHRQVRSTGLSSVATLLLVCKEPPALRESVHC